MGLYRNLSGEVRVRLTSADLMGALAALNTAAIPLKDAQSEDELNVCFTVSRRDYRKLRVITRRRGDLVRLLGRVGVYWDLKGLLKRPVLVTGLGMLLALAVFVPSRVCIIEVQGNTAIPVNRILEAAASSGIRFGASRQAVRSESMKNALLEAMPELAWAGVNTYGCRAVITVREREPQPALPENDIVSNIVAVRDGYILSCDVLSGSGLCVPGQAVKEGEILISGYTDCGIRITAARAAGEVMAATRRQITALTPAECMERGEETGEGVRYSLIVGKKRINFNNSSGISGASCGRMVTNYYLTLPGGYRLPVTLVKETVTDADLSAAKTDGAVLEGFAGRYLGTQMIAGTVTAAMETVTGGDGVWVLTGDYACTEMIGRERAEQNGELHETN